MIGNAAAVQQHEGLVPTQATKAGLGLAAGGAANTLADTQR